MEHGDIIWLEYELWDLSTNKLYETNIEKSAREHEIYDAEKKYGPKVVIFGEGQLLPSLEDALKEVEVGQEIEVELSPEDAFGERNPKLVETVSRYEVERRGITPQVGMEINWKQGKAYITLVSAGRVRIDRNHPLAGKRIKYKIKVNKKAEDVEDKVNGLMELHGINGNASFSEDKKTCIIELRPEADILVFDKSGFVNNVFSHTDIDKLEFRVVYKKGEKAEDQSSNSMSP